MFKSVIGRLDTGIATCKGRKNEMQTLTRKDLTGKKIDIHTHCVGVMLNHLINQKYPICQDINDLSNIVINNGIDYAVTFPIPFSIYYDPTEFLTAQKLKPSHLTDFPFQAENFTMLSSISKFKLSHLLPFVSVSTGDKVAEQISFIKELLKQYPIYGIKYHSSLDLCAADDKLFEPFARLAVEYDLPVMFHTKMDRYANPMNLLNFAERYPDLRICAAHFGQMYRPFYEKLCMDDRYQNVYIDCAPLTRNFSAISTMDPDMHIMFPDPISMLKGVIREYHQKLLWGSDVPWHRYVNDQNCIVDYPDEKNYVDESGLWEEFTNNSISFLFG